MLPDATLPVPASLMTLLASFTPLFTALSFRTFTMLACGFLAQTGKRTVCGMLAGADLARCWSHDRAHFFFARARWTPDELGLAVARLVAALLVPAGDPVTIAIDDTLSRAVERTVPFQLACQAIATTWYAIAGHDPADVADHRARAPWYTTKSQPSTADMLAKLRRILIATKYRASHPDQPTPEEINVIRLAWEDAAA